MSTDSQINNLLDNIESLEQEIDAKRSIVSEASTTKSNYEQRLKEVKSVQTKLSSSFEDDIEDIRSLQFAESPKLINATSGLSNTTSLVSAITGDIELNTDTDFYGSQMHDSLQNEISRCQDEIDSAKATISSENKNVNNLCSRRTSLVRQARQLAKQDDATVSVNKAIRY